MSKVLYKNLIAFHPGYYVREYIEDQKITQEELAKRLQTTPKYVSNLVNGEISLTDDMALKLSIVFGTSIEMWLNLNEKYIEKTLEIKRQKCLDEECELVKMIDYKFWVNLGLVRQTSNAVERVQELLRFFKVSSLSVLEQRNFLVQYKQSIPDIKSINIINANAWVQTAINIGTTIDTESFDKNKLIDSIPEIRGMTLQNPDVFYPKLKELLAKCGIALVLLPNLKNCGVNGAVKWLGKNKAILALNDRRKYADIFWFALFHEIGHVLQHRIKVLMISAKENCGLQTDELIQKLEEEANKFAQDTMIPENEYENFLQDNPDGFSEKSICSFAKKINIQPGIVVGRLQSDKKISYRTKLNSIKEQYEIE